MVPMAEGAVEVQQPEQAGYWGLMTEWGFSTRWSGRRRSSCPMSTERSLSWKRSAMFRKRGEVLSYSFVFYCEAAEAAGYLFIFI